MQLIFLNGLQETTMSNSDRKMLSSVLGLSVLFSACSAMLLPNMTSNLVQKGQQPEEEGSSYDPNTSHWPETGKNHSSVPDPQWPWETRSGPIWPPSENMTNYADGLRMLATSSPLLPEPDTSICDILFSQPVPPSIDQIPFFCVCSYCKGTVGPKGDRGDRGPPGEPGSPGMRGMMGFKGYRGFTGPQGTKGQKGDSGEKGQSGPAGFTGTKGDRGFKGEKGDQGLSGPPGAQGPQGEMGTCPASCESAPGAPGLPGLPGPVGARGLPGVQGIVGATGVKGDKGDTGVAGNPGVNGQKGDHGEQGICDCKNGTDGTNGAPGEKGSKGDKGDAGSQGIQGSTGLKGDQGNMGVMGPPGPCSPAIQSAFSACINQSFPAANWPVAFPDILTNEQRHFDPSMGIYTAPINGTYVFSFHLATNQKPLKVGLFRNFYPVARVTEASSQTTASHTVVLHLSRGDQVWMQVKDSLTNGMFTDSESKSTFSGFLLHPDSCDMPMGRDFSPPPPSGGFSWDGHGGHHTTLRP
ncbi:inner ear-specific collagen [Xiphophorus couchianus]|uniref:inner ear-specific collagen n=1 Tax=Xiphophorus couchianus TaxID=32473 RepID=UPI00101697FE|nr:inner ear-specific collagen-like [Xiphophorus couchianus]